MATLARLHGRRMVALERQVSRNFFSRSKDKLLSEEERAKESVFIQKMERERLEKLKKKMVKEHGGGDKVETSARGGSAEEAEQTHAVG